MDKRKWNIQGKTHQEIQDFIVQNIGKDQRLQQLMLGVVIGLFTEDEYQIYLKDEKEYNRRIRSMLIQRLESHLLT